MIDIEKLNKKKTYLGYTYGDSSISKSIQYCSKDDTDIPQDEIASHVFGLVFKKGGWYVYESHLVWNGVKKLLYTNWIKDYTRDKIFCFPRTLNISVLEFYANPLFNPGYSKASIFGLALEALSDKLFWNDSPGMVCSEFIARADKGFKICYKYKLKTHQIKPIHWQMLDTVNL